MFHHTKEAVFGKFGVQFNDEISHNFQQVYPVKRDMWIWLGSPVWANLKEMEIKGKNKKNKKAQLFG